MACLHEGSLGRCAVRHAAAYACTQTAAAHLCSRREGCRICEQSNHVGIRSVLIVYILHAMWQQADHPASRPDTAGAQLSCRGACTHGIKSGLNHGPPVLHALFHWQRAFQATMRRLDVFDALQCCVVEALRRGDEVLQEYLSCLVALHAALLLQV